MKPFHDETPYLWLLFQQPHLRKTVNTVIHLSKDKGLLWADGSQLPTKTDRQLCGFNRNTVQNELSIFRRESIYCSRGDSVSEKI